MKTILHWAFWVLILAAVWGISRQVRADPVVAFEQQGVRIVVYNEPCALKGAVSNLPNRATWTENGQTFEGCVQAFPQFGVAAFYFTDKSIAIVPLQMFQKVIGA
jgi:hypothetical protein